MAIVYISSIDNPLNKPVRVFPPSVYESEWFATFMTALKAQEIALPHLSVLNPYLNAVNWMGPLNLEIKFNNQSEYTAWVEKYKLTDKTLIDDIIVWNNAHGLIHTYKVESDDGTLVPLIKLAPVD